MALSSSCESEQNVVVAYTMRTNYDWWYAHCTLYELRICSLVKSVAANASINFELVFPILICIMGVWVCAKNATVNMCEALKQKRTRNTLSNTLAWEIAATSNYSVFALKRSQVIYIYMTFDAWKIVNYIMATDCIMQKSPLLYSVHDCTVYLPSSVTYTRHTNTLLGLGITTLQLHSTLRDSISQLTWYSNQSRHGKWIIFFI